MGGFIPTVSHGQTFRSPPAKPGVYLLKLSVCCIIYMLGEDKMKKSQITILLIIGFCTLIVIGFAIYISYDLDYYFFYNRSDRSSWIHPSANVLLFCTFIIVEAAILAMIIVSPKPKRLWFRGIIGMILLIPWVCYSTMFVVHMPGYILIHHLWAWLITLVVIFVSLFSAVVHTTSIIRQKIYYRQKAA
jgi:hypothetical protein